jgi:hypothetical protein
MQSLGFSFSLLSCHETLHVWWQGSHLHVQDGMEQTQPQQEASVYFSVIIGDIWDRELYPKPPGPE